MSNPQPKTAKVTQVTTAQELVDLFGKPGNNIFNNINDDEFVDSLLNAKRSIFTHAVAPSSIPVSSGGTTNSFGIPQSRYGRTRTVNVPLEADDWKTTPFDCVYVADLIKADKELCALLEEQPAVRELYDRLQTMIRLYRE